MVELWGFTAAQEWGGRPGHRMGRDCTRQAGRRDGVCELGSRAEFPRSPRGQRSGLGRFRPQPLSPAEGQTRSLLLRGLLPPGPFLLLRHGRSQFARFISLLPPRAPTIAEGSPLRSRPALPHSSGRSASALPPSSALPRSQSPQLVHTARGKRKAKAASAEARFSEPHFSITAHWDV